MPGTSLIVAPIVTAMGGWQDLITVPAATSYDLLDLSIENTSTLYAILVACRAVDSTGRVIRTFLNWMAIPAAVASIDSSTIPVSIGTLRADGPDRLVLPAGAKIQGDCSDLPAANSILVCASVVVET